MVLGHERQNGELNRVSLRRHPDAYGMLDENYAHHTVLSISNCPSRDYHSSSALDLHRTQCWSVMPRMENVLTNLYLWLDRPISWPTRRHFQRQACLISLLCVFPWFLEHSGNLDCIQPDNRQETKASAPTTQNDIEFVTVGLYSLCLTWKPPSFRARAP